MSNVKIVLNNEGIQAFLHGDEVRTMLEGISQRMVQRCGKGYRYKITDNKRRSCAQIRAGTKTAKLDNLRNNTLLKNLW